MAKNKNIYQNIVFVPKHKWIIFDVNDAPHFNFLKFAYSKPASCNEYYHNAALSPGTTRTSVYLVIYVLPV